MMGRKRGNMIMMKRDDEMGNEGRKGNEKGKRKGKVRKR